MVHGQDRVTGLLHEGVHHRRNVLASGSGERRPEILGDGVAVALAREIPANAPHESLLPEKIAKHPDDARTFGIGDGVKDVVDFVRMAYGHLHRVRGLEAVESQCLAEDVAQKDVPDAPLWEDVIKRTEFHEPSEALVEPQVCPPLHGHEVTKPHVGKLMANGARATDDVIKGSTGGVQQNLCLSVRDGSPVLHGAGCKVGNGQEVKLGQWEGFTILRLEEGKRTLSHAKGMASQLSAAQRRVHPELDPRGRPRRDCIKLADYERQEVR
mmetsp:Transcript_70342/g.205718  ORF Transcript_70342/g.205718 Transcript_70342/m.205718 type:complete len:269 (-) Transcript_70342:712-1518(-)